MIKSRNLIFALAILLAAGVAAIKADPLTRDDGTLRQFSNGARHWTAVHYYDRNHGGYQTSATSWTRQVFH